MMHCKWFFGGHNLSVFLLHVASSVDPYTLVFEGMSWVEAQKFCRLHETDLASVRSLRESEEIQNILQENMEVWIGLHRDSWNWSDGTNFSFSSWSDGQPDNDVNPEACVSMLNGGWNDTLCSTGLYFICQGESQSTRVPKSSTARNRQLDSVRRGKDAARGRECFRSFIHSVTEPSLRTLSRNTNSIHHDHHHRPAR